MSARHSANKVIIITASPVFVLIRVPEASTPGWRVSHALWPLQENSVQPGELFPPSSFLGGVWQLQAEIAAEYLTNPEASSGSQSLSFHICKMGSLGA